MEDVVDLSSWSVGVSLIVLTIAIHTTAVLFMAFGTYGVRTSSPMRDRDVP